MMKLHNHTHRSVAAALFATMAVSAIAPAAFAGHGKGSKKNRGGDYRGGGYSQPVVVERHSSSAGPAIAGFIGGLAVGTILSNHGGDTYAEGGYYDDGYNGRGRGRASYGASVQVSNGYYGGSAYYYEDPWNGRRYDNLNAYRSQCNGHWPIARVIDARSGSCVQTVCWHDGGWHDYDASDPPWAHGYRGDPYQGYNRGGYDRGGYYADDRGRYGDDNRGCR